MARENEAGWLILRARRTAGLSQAELARRAGITHSVLSAYEHGRRDPGTRALTKLLEAAGFALTVTSRPVDLARAGRQLADALSVADRIPLRRRGELTYPRLR